MNDEIKEILDNTLEYLEGIDETRNTKILTTNETNILLDYITNLQEEYRQTKLLKERYQLEKEDYKSRIDEAIDKLYCYGEVFDSKILQKFQKEMLNILGGDK